MWHGTEERTAGEEKGFGCRRMRQANVCEGIWSKLYMLTYSPLYVRYFPIAVERLNHLD